MKIVQPSATLLAITTDALTVIETAGRTCYKSEGAAAPGTAEPFIAKRLLPGDEDGDVPHEGLLEHATATFRVVCDRGVSHEFVRHRIGMSYAQESTRYCNYGKRSFGREITVIEPPDLNSECFTIWADACRNAESAYLHLLEQGVAAQIARSVLPTCLKTEFVVTGNFHAWLHFLRLRTSKKAHPQMREIACIIQHELRQAFPVVFSQLHRKSARAERRDQILRNMARTQETSDCCGKSEGCIWCGRDGVHGAGCPTLLAREALGWPLDKEPVDGQV